MHEARSSSRAEGAEGEIDRGSDRPIIERVLQTEGPIDRLLKRVLETEGPIDRLLKRVLEIEGPIDRLLKRVLY